MNGTERAGICMKAIAWASGILSVLLLTLLLTGWADADYAAKRALSQGNQQYAVAKFAQALAAYEAGLAADPENEALNFNAAQAAYMAGDYEKAAQYYEKSGNSVDKYLNGGNIYFKVGDAVEDDEAKAQCYSEALLIYHEGIVKFPQNVPLKYNFELVREKLEQLMEDMEQEGDSEDGEEGEDESESESQSQSGEEGEDEDQSEGQSGEDSEDESEEGASQDSQEQDEEDQGESGEGEEQEAESAESEDGDGENDEESAGRDSDGQDQEDEQQSSYNQEDAEYEQDREAIDRILEVLESLEQESLKNNQNVVRGKEGKNGW